MKSKIIVKHGDVTIEVEGKTPKEIITRYKDLLWELGYPVQGGKPFAPDFIPARLERR